MDNAKQHWKILQELGNELENRVRSFLVIGENGEGVIVVTENGDGFWFGKMGSYKKGETRTATKPTPLNVPGLVQMAQGYRHILLLNKRGEIYSIGWNNSGQLELGIDDNKSQFSPQLISIPHKFTLVRCGGGHSLALTEDGNVWSWGLNNYGQVGVPSSTRYLPSPRQISELDSHRVVALEGGAQHSLALTDQGVVYCWGTNDLGQFLAQSGSKHTPTLILTPSPVRSMAAGCWRTLLLTRTGEVYSCGWNRNGQLDLPTTADYCFGLSKVAGLPPISQIASHSFTFMSIAISTKQRCFVWGELRDGTVITTPQQLPPFYSTVESPFAFYSTSRSTPRSVTIPETPLSPMSARMSRLFDNPETSPDVQFVVEQRTIHAHRIILSNSSDYFARMFSERWFASVDPEDPIVRVAIPDHSYFVFHAFLRFLYTDCLEVSPDLLFELFELASQYLVSDLEQLCLSRMRATIIHN